VSASTVKPIRSVVYATESDLDNLDVLLGYGSDAIIVDLEEPKTPFPEHEQIAMRRRVRAFFDALVGRTDGRQWFVRVQPPDSGNTLKDLAAVMGPALTGVFLPKVYGPADIYRTESLLSCLEVDFDLPMGSTILYPILETAQSLRLAYEIATASERVKYMGGAISRFGDIHQAIGYRWTEQGDETLLLRSKVVIDARAAGIRYPISGMWGGATNDHDGFLRFATQLRNLGYYGMLLNDPSHVALAHEVFSPSQEEIAYWQDLDRLTREAEQAGSGTVTYGDANQGEGHIVHIAHVGSARMNLQWARDLGMID